MALPRRVALLVLVVAVGLLLAAIGVAAMTVPAQEQPGQETPVDEGPAEESSADESPDADGLEDLHAAGYTGENVSIGIVDVTGFDRSDAAIADRVAAARAFGPGATVEQGGHSDHGTAAATVAAETAPDAALYLAAFESQGGYERAVQWLLASDVDVIVAPVSFYGTPGDGSTRVSTVTTDAVRQDAVFVAAAGNLADGHWRTRYDAVDDGRLVVANGSTRNYLRGEGGHVTLWLSWDEAHADESYTVELYRDPAGANATGDGPERVARSRPFTRDDVPSQRLEADVEGGRYFAVVRGPAAPTGTRLRLTSPTHDLQRATPRGSLVAPATAEEVLSVGAYDVEGGHVELFSSRGPTLDRRRGIDVVAPARHAVRDGDPFVGTSAAAPYAGGVAALLRQVDPDASPRSIEHALEATATDVAVPGPDLAAGHGRIDPTGAVLGLNASR